MPDVISIPATDLRKGMQTFRRDPRGGKLKRDVRIGDPFTTSGPERFQPLAFTSIGPDGQRAGTVVYSPCATVLIGTGAKKGKRR